MVVLDTVELPFKLPNFDAICIHLLTGARPVFVELVDDQRRVPVYHDVFDAELNGYTKFVETSSYSATLLEAKKCIWSEISFLGQPSWQWS